MTDEKQPTIPRTVTMPVAEPLSGSWKELRDALGEMWAMSTQAANWLMRELYARDARRDGGVAKMPKYEYTYLYPELREHYPQLPSQTAASLIQTVTRKYKSVRYQVIWTSAVSLPTFRYPMPFPVHNQSWKCYFDPGNRPIVYPRIADKRWELRLRGGPRYRRQIAAFRQMAEGEADSIKRGELAIYRNHDGEILCKMVGHFPKPNVSATATGVLRLRTDHERLFVALDDKDERIWNLNFDHVKRWIAEYADTLQRLREDRKAEQRLHPFFESRQQAIVEKHRNRMKSAIQEVAA